MKVSLNTVQKLVNFKLPPIDELVARINAQLGGVEQVVDLRTKYKYARIVKVVSCQKHPDADKLTVCLIDDGGVVESIERDSDGLVQVVCGAPNVHDDMWAVWLPPESTVPTTFDDPEPFVLDARKLRGVMSYGMLAAGDELDINDDHDGIVEITDRDLSSGYNPDHNQNPSQNSSHTIKQSNSLHEGRTFMQGGEMKTGMSFAEVFGLDDVIIEIENKMFTHRPDCFGQLGVAREIAGIFGHKFTSPDWYSMNPELKDASGLDLEVFNDSNGKSARFMAVALSGVEVKPSPLWLQIELMRWGSKPINNIVDLTNWIMLYSAQPTHAYDYDKLRGAKLGVRIAKNGEKATLLNGKEYQFSSDDVVIVDGERVVGLAGIMGGIDTEVDQNTKNIVLEVANFDMYTLRRSAMRHGIFTDALARFNKGQSPLQTDRIINYLMNNIDAEQASRVFYEGEFDGCISPDGKFKVDSLGITNQFINQRLGTELSNEEISNILTNTEFLVEVGDGGMDIYEPFWRTDISLPEDVVEEVGRLHNFDRLPRQLPLRSTRPVAKSLRRQTKQDIRDYMENLGANEVLTYSFVNEKVIKNANQDAEKAFKISNALSPDLQYYRLSVLPSLLDKVHMNIKAGHDDFVLYEIGKGHIKDHYDDDGLPSEINLVDAVYASKKPAENIGAAYFYMRNLLEKLCGYRGVELVFKPIDSENDYSVMKPFEVSRSATVETKDGQVLGLVGELKQSIIHNFKLPNHVAAMTLDLEQLEKAFNAPRQNYRPLSRYPSITQDISLKVANDVNYQEIYDRVYKLASDLAGDVEISQKPVSIYRSDDDKSQKTITLSLKFTSHNATLRDDDISSIMKKVADQAIVT